MQRELLTRDSVKLHAETTHFQGSTNEIIMYLVPSVTLRPSW